MTIPSGVAAAHAIDIVKHYYHLDASGTYTKQHSLSNLGNVVFNASGANITCTKPSNVDKIDLILPCGHYYRFEAGITSLLAQCSRCTAYVTGGKTVTVS